MPVAESAFEITQRSGNIGNPFAPYQPPTIPQGAGPGGSFATYFTASTPRTTDLRSLDANTQRSRLAHEMLMRGRLAEAESDNELLQSATPDELANLFNPPRTEREWRLQRIVQRDHDQKERGARLIWSEPQKVAFAQKQANLTRTLQDIELDPQRFQLQQNNFLAQVANNQALRRQAALNAEATERWRLMQNANAEASRDQRERFNVERGQEAGFGQMIAIERMLQSAANAEEKNRRDYYRDAADALKEGAVAGADVRRMFAGNFQPPTIEMLEGFGRQRENELAQQMGDQNADIEAQADVMNQQLINAQEIAQPAWYRRLAGARAPSVEQLSHRIMQRMLTDRALGRRFGGRIEFDPQANKFVPRLRGSASAGSGAGGVSGPAEYGDDEEERAWDNMMRHYGVDDDNGATDMATPQTHLPEGARFIQNGVVWAMQGGRRVALGAAQSYQEGQFVRNRRTGEVFRVEGGQLVRVR